MLRRITGTLGLLVLASVAHSRVIEIHQASTGDTLTIETAAGVAVDGDTLLVHPGRYEIELTIADKSLTLLGAGPAADVILTRKPYQSVGQPPFIRVSATTPRSFRAENISFVDGRNLNYAFGGAIHLEDVATVSMIRCMFSGNRTLGGGYVSFTYGGAVSILEAADVEISDCEFRGNSSQGNLHGAGSGGAISAGATSIVIRRCLFDSNHAYASYCGGSGGALSVSGSSVVIDDCVFTGNGASFGGAISTFGNLYVRQSEFRGNGGGHGSGPCFDRPGSIVHARGGAAAFEDNLFIANEGDAAVIRSVGPGPFSLERSTLAFNGRAGGQSPALQVDSGAGVPVAIRRNLIAFNHGPGISLSATDLGNVACNLVWGNQPDFPNGPDFRGTNDNQASDPLFCDTAGSGNTVAANSPCLTGGSGHPEACGVIGNVVPGCNAVNVEISTWGAIKARFRD